MGKPQLDCTCSRCRAIKGKEMKINCVECLWYKKSSDGDPEYHGCEVLRMDFPKVLMNQSCANYSRGTELDRILFIGDENEETEER